MKSARVLLILCSLAASTGLLAPDTRAVELQEAKADHTVIPTPPAQHQPWTPPSTKLGTGVVLGMTELFQKGAIADPRGGEYREIEITGEKSAEKLHGWVLASKEPLAVCWNGTVQRLDAIGAPADLNADVAALLAPGPKARDPGVKKNSAHAESAHATDWLSLRCNSMGPLHAALLLRLGHAEKAEALWNRWAADEAKKAGANPLAFLPPEWINLVYDRAIAAHLAGDDQLALTLLRELHPQFKAMEATAAKRGTPEGANAAAFLPPSPRLSALLADQERRAMEVPYQPVLASGQPAHGPERVEGLIRDLELIHVEPMTSFSQTDVVQDPIVKALVAEGGSAVGALLLCLREDDRLTRSVFSRNMTRGPMIPVYEAAYVALVSILQKPIFIDLPGEPDPRLMPKTLREELADKIEAYWIKNKDIPLPERWYAALRDDRANKTDWFLAAENIVMTPSQSSVPVNMFGGGVNFYFGNPKSPIVRKGDSLRTLTNPSVSELMVKRARQLLNLAPLDLDPGEWAFPSTEPDHTYRRLSYLLIALVDWDGLSHVGDLRELAAALKKKYPNAQPVETIAILCERRHALGDPTALTEYADYLAATTPDQIDATETFRLMCENAAAPAIERAAEKMFGTPDSPWKPVPSNRGGLALALVDSPLISVAAYRSLLFTGLADTHPAGWVQLLKDGSLELATGAKLDDFNAEEGRWVAIRNCDLLAWRLARVREFPEIDLTGKARERDAAVSHCKEFLKTYGDRYRPAPRKDTSWRFDDHDPPSFAMTPLDHPATADDVAQGRAIFCLSGTTRVCPLPVYPLPASRPASKRARPASAALSSGEYSHQQDITGKIWQAEEVLVDGQWQRFYGFAGRHELERVPASELELPPR